MTALQYTWSWKGRTYVFQYTVEEDDLIVENCIRFDNSGEAVPLGEPALYLEFVDDLDSTTEAQEQIDSEMWDNYETAIAEMRDRADEYDEDADPRYDR